MPVSKLDPRIAEAGITVNGQLTDAAIRHGVFLEAYNSSEVDDILEFLNNDLHPDIVGRVEHALKNSKGVFTKQRLAALGKSNEQLIRSAMFTASTRVTLSLIHI